MIPHGVEIFIGVEPIDLRWGFDRLAARESKTRFSAQERRPVISWTSLT
jgi:hypothetical protein